MSEDLILPVYIDTNALLDLLASIEGGFSLVEKVTSRSSVSTQGERTVAAGAGTEFGIPNVLSLLKIKLGGSFSSKKDDTVASKEKPSAIIHMAHCYTGSVLSSR